MSTWKWTLTAVTNRGSVSNYAQTLDMKGAALTTTFDVGDKLSVKHTMMALQAFALFCFVRGGIDG
ncbi:MAG: hypothetical protein R2788_22345 [Saprospiraceae bacterium]